MVPEFSVVIVPSPVMVSVPLLVIGLPVNPEAATIVWPCKSSLIFLLAGISTDSPVIVISSYNLMTVSVLAGAAAIAASRVLYPESPALIGFELASLR